jgi:hypothetical protein
MQPPALSGSTPLEDEEAAAGVPQPSASTLAGTPGKRRKTGAGEASGDSPLKKRAKEEVGEEEEEEEEESEDADAAKKGQRSKSPNEPPAPGRKEGMEGRGEGKGAASNKRGRQVSDADERGGAKRGIVKKIVDADQLFSFVASLAKNPYLRVTESNPVRCEVLNVRDTFYTGPPFALGARRKTPTPLPYGGLPSERSSSLSATPLAQSGGANSGGGNSNNGGGGSSSSASTTAPTWRKNFKRPCSPSNFANESEDPRRPERLRAIAADPQANLKDLLATYHAQSFSAAPDDINGPSLLIRNRKGLLAGLRQANGEEAVVSKAAAKVVAAQVPLLGINHHTSLGALVSPLYRPSIAEQWSPHEVKTFEAAICLYGKKFHSIAKAIGTKSTQQVVAFFYHWKGEHNQSYRIWKKTFHAGGG